MIEAPEFKDSISGSMLMLKLNKASEKNGRITHYLIIVVTEAMASQRNPEHFTLSEVCHTEFNSALFNRNTEVE